MTTDRQKKMLRDAMATLGEMHLIGEGKEEVKCHDCGKHLEDDKDVFYMNDDYLYPGCKPCYEKNEREMAEHDPNDLSWIMEDAQHGLDKCLLNLTGSLDEALVEEVQPTHNTYANRKG